MWKTNTINKYWIYINRNLQTIKDSQTKCMKGWTIEIKFCVLHNLLKADFAPHTFIVVLWDSWTFASQDKMIKNMSLGWILSWALDMCGLGPLIQLIIIFYYFLFELVNLYTAVISEIVFQFEVTYIVIVPHSWKWTFQKNSPSENIFVHLFCVKERERGIE